MIEKCCIKCGTLNIDTTSIYCPQCGNTDYKQIKLKYNGN